MKRLFIAEPPARPAELHISAAETKQTKALIADAGRVFTPAVRAGDVWCSRCGRSIAAERVRAHRCEP
jgi:hypothetical protein